MKHFIMILAAICLLIAPGAALAADKPGGTFRVGIEASTNLDPGFITNPPDMLIIFQAYEHLVDIDPATYNPVPGLAASWESTDGKTWTFKIRDQAKFWDGTPVTSKDVAWTFNRLRDPEVGTPSVSLYANVADIKTPDDQTVVFELKETNPEFPADCGEHHAGIIPDGVTNPTEKHLSSGAYYIKEYYPEDRVIMAKNPHFNRKAADGSDLGKFEEIHFIFSPDIPGQVEALRGGDLDFVGMLPFEVVEAIENDPNTKLILGDENEQMVIHMRVDGDRVAKDVRVRQALKLGTNLDDIIAAVRPGLAVPGNTTPVGPPYRDYYLDRKPVFDPAKAKALLAEAGYPDGFEIRFMVPTWGQNSQIATVWAQQMAQIGVKVNINMIPSDQFYSDAPDNWLECDFGVGPWGTRATPVVYYNLAYVTGAPWNGCHWSDPEFDELVGQINMEMDKAKRIELYKKSQEIFIDRGPSIAVYVQKASAASSVKVENLQLGYAWITTRFWGANFAE
ncbi:MAG: ABC transporter substrate-binding protein [Deltaproteobacteria bacterium]|jgi:peptide/nickel transport system substrate-binding protein|nr:ABC transporter substrate-binding protein [Deltaproteobacteria bacterium]